jgi:hypothetical protein
MALLRDTVDESENGGTMDMGLQSSKRTFISQL